MAQTEILPFLGAVVSSGIVNSLGNADAASGRDRLEPCGQVHGSTEKIAAFHDDLARGDPDPKDEAWPIAFADAQGCLNGECASYGRRRIGELGQHAVSRRVEDTSGVHVYQAVDKLTAVGERSQSERLIGSNGIAIANGISRQDGYRFLVQGLAHGITPEAPHGIRRS
ncbi:MAG TPA: hypothetical protein VNS34_23565 [Rhizobiaceae bacterium]|nr:hypothetical protein [Rhizobiaceae bacterium]